MKKISIVTRSMAAGGAERVISQLVNYLVKDYAVSLILMEDHHPNFYKISENCDFRAIKCKSKNRILKKAESYIKLRKIINEINPDVVLSMPEEIGIYVILALLGTKHPVVVSERNNPWVMPNKKVTRALRKMLYPFANGFVFQTKQSASFFSDKIQAKGIILPNPLDLDRLPMPYNGTREKIIVGAGRMEPQKNFPLLISAFAKFYESHNDYKLVIYGEGNLKDELEALAASKIPASAFEFPGRVSDLVERINTASMFVLSSDFEGMPNVLIEAMACGVPSISTDCPSGGSAELINDGENGFLVPVGDEDAMLEKMLLLANDSELSTKVGHNSVSVRENLDSEVISKKWEDYLFNKI